MNYTLPSIILDEYGFLEELLNNQHIYHILYW